MPATPKYEFDDEPVIVKNLQLPFPLAREIDAYGVGRFTTGMRYAGI